MLRSFRSLFLHDLNDPKTYAQPGASNPAQRFQMHDRNDLNDPKHLAY